MRNVDSRNPKGCTRWLLAKINVFLMLLPGLGAGATAYVLGNAFAVVAGAPSTGASQQSATTTSTNATAHNCTLGST